MKNILVTIVNYNLNDEALNLKSIFKEHFSDVMIIDSGSPVQPEEFDIKLPNVGYSGLFNESCKQAIDKNCDWLFFICSDVSMKKSDVLKLKDYINMLPDDVGLYSPSSVGQSHKHCKNNSTNNLRDVVFIEGFMFAVKTSILEQAYPVDLNVNRLGHGIDAYKAFLCYKNNLRCVIDDRLCFYHREGTGYNTAEASRQFVNWMNLPGMESFRDFWNLYLSTGADSNETLKILKKVKV